MKNFVECKNCHSENPAYGLICTNCKSYLRERIFNIDLFHTISLLIESPGRAFSLIIQSEHKNFIFVISLLVSLKLLTDSMFVSLLTLSHEPVFGSFVRNYLIVFGEMMFVVLIVSLVFKWITAGFGVLTRIKDNFSILIYSLMPYVFGAVILLIVELTVFGGNLFSRNPSPFILKELLAYVFAAFEILLVLWSVFLSGSAFFAQTKNILYSLLSALYFNLMIYFIVYLNTFYLFN